MVLSLRLLSRSYMIWSLILILVTWTAPANIYYISSVTHGKVLVLTFPNNLSRPTWPTYSWFRFVSYLNDGRASILAFSDESLNLQALTIARNTCKIKCVNGKTCLRTPPPLKPKNRENPQPNHRVENVLGEEQCGTIYWSCGGILILYSHTISLIFLYFNGHSIKKRNPLLQSSKFMTT